MGHGMFIPDMVEEDEGGISARQPNRFILPLLVAPTPDDKPDAFNTVRHSLITVACKDVPDRHFEFDSSFVEPEARKALEKLPGTIKRHPGAPLAIWGHTDPEGNIDYNQFLSERRAEAVFALLIRDVDAWERLFSSAAARGKAVGDVWGDNAIRTILESFGFDFEETEKETLKDAIKRFESARGDANPAGRNDVALRKRLFTEYMNSICVDEKGVPFSLKRTDFLGEGGERGPFQGCSEFNPQMILAKAETDAFAKDKKSGKQARHEANRDNRRVMIFFFAAGTTIDPKKWACPRAKEGTKKCRDHLFSDHKERTEKQFPNRRRRFGKQVRNETDRFSRPEMTFGCRFYHALAQRSPCERDLQMYAIKLEMDGPKQKGRDGVRRLVPVVNVRWVATIGEAVTPDPAARVTQAPVVRGRTTANGMIGIPFVSAVTTIILKVDLASAILGGIPLEVPEEPNAAPQSGGDTDRFDDEETFVTYTLRPDALFRLKQKPNPEVSPINPDFPLPLEPDDDDPPVANDERDTGARQRLFNLGYGTGLSEITTAAEFRNNVSRFQKDSRLANTNGVLDNPTIDELLKQHGS